MNIVHYSILLFHLFDLYFFVNLKILVNDTKFSVSGICPAMNPANRAKEEVEMTASEIMEAHFELGDLMDSFKPGLLYGMVTPCINVCSVKNTIIKVDFDVDNYIFIDSLYFLQYTI